MQEKQVLERAFAMPLTSPAYPPGPYRFVNRQYLIITYRTDPAKLRGGARAARTRRARSAGEVRIHPYAGFERLRRLHREWAGDPVSFRGRKGSYTHCMFLNDEGPIAGGRELWGFPKKLAQPTLRTEIDTLVGTLDYGPLRVATGTMGYKHREADLAQVKASLAAPNFLLKIIPHVDGKPRICELVEYHLEDVMIRGAWTGPAALHLSPHALAPVAELPVLEIVSGIHILADLTLGLGRVAHDYLRQPSREALRINEMALAT